MQGGDGFSMRFFKFRSGRQNTPAPVRAYDDEDDNFGDDEDAGESDE